MPLLLPISHFGYKKTPAFFSLMFFVIQIDFPLLWHKSKISKVFFQIFIWNNPLINRFLCSANSSAASDLNQTSVHIAFHHQINRLHASIFRLVSQKLSCLFNTEYTAAGNVIVCMVALFGIFLIFAPFLPREKLNLWFVSKFLLSLYRFLFRTDMPSPNVLFHRSAACRSYPRSLRPAAFLCHEILCS